MVQPYSLAGDVADDTSQPLGSPVARRLLPCWNPGAPQLRALLRGARRRNGGLAMETTRPRLGRQRSGVASSGLDRAESGCAVVHTTHGYLTGRRRSHLL